MNISALDENGKTVDWWFIYKVPKLAKAASNPSATGYEYVYYDPKIAQVVEVPLRAHGRHRLARCNAALSLCKARADNPLGAVQRRDAQCRQPQRRHTKGVIAFDTGSKTALLLLHSWPKFAAPEASEMPIPMYGQTFLCLSLDSTRRVESRTK